jgi:hypothetical protein
MPAQLRQRVDRWLAAAHGRRKSSISRSQVKFFGFQASRYVVRNSFVMRDLLPEERVLEYVHAVVFEVCVLLSGELTHAYAGVDTPRIQQLVPDLRDNDQLLDA